MPDERFSVFLGKLEHEHESDILMAEDNVNFIRECFHEANAPKKKPQKTILGHALKVHKKYHGKALKAHKETASGKAKVQKLKDESPTGKSGCKAKATALYKKRKHHAQQIYTSFKTYPTILLNILKTCQRLR